MPSSINIELIQRVITNARGWWCDFSGESDELAILNSSSDFAKEDFFLILSLFCDIHYWSAIDPNDESGIKWDAAIEPYEVFKLKAPNAVPFLKI